jgi:hypothetical protein
MKISRLAMAAGAFGLAMLLPACGDPLAPISVEVKVSLDGTPVEGATITLMPKDSNTSKGGRTEGGFTNAQGIAKVSGPRGQYKVVIKKLEATNMGAFDPKGDNTAMINKMKQNMVKSKPGAPAKSTEPKNFLPAKYGTTDSSLTLTIPPEKTPVEFNLTK